MINMNQKMVTESRNMARVDGLPLELAKVVDQGFLLKDDFVILAALSKINTNATVGDFPDKTGYECFINSIHIDDYVDSNYLAYACLFVENCFAEWRRGGRAGNIIAIISNDDFGAVIKFHLMRNSESWVGPDLDEYEDAVLVADSTLISLF